MENYLNDCHPSDLPQSDWALQKLKLFQANWLLPNRELPLANHTFIANQPLIGRPNQEIQLWVKEPVTEKELPVHPSCDLLALYRSTGQARSEFHAKFSIQTDDF